MKPCQVDEKSTCTSFDVGDVEGALAKSEKVVKGSIDTPRQEHFYEETSLAIVVPVGEDDEYKIYYPTPAILFAQQMVSVSFTEKKMFNQNIQRFQCFLVFHSTG